MAFLYPSFLWALAAVLVPVVIHLFNFRRYKKVYFSNVRFLRELQMETKSRSRLKELLVLAARCLALASLVLAFSRPFAPSAGSTPNSGAPRIAVYIDNSYSMENVGRHGPLLEVARKEAKDLVKAYGGSARFYIVTNNFDGGEQRWRTQDDAMEFIENIRVCPVPRTLAEVSKRQQGFLARTGDKPAAMYYFSDVQKSTFGLEDLNPDTTAQITVFPLRVNKVNNVVADTCWFVSPVRQQGFSQRLRAQVVNRGDNNIDAGSARLFLNGQQVALSTFSVRAGSTATVDFSYVQKSGGFHYGRVEIEDYPVTFDDRLHFAYDARMNISVAAINGANAQDQNALAALFRNDSVFDFRTFSESAVDYGAFATADLIVLNQVEEVSSGMLSELQKYADGGGGIVIVPPAGPGPSYDKALSSFGLPLPGAPDTAAVSAATIDPASGFWTGVFEKLEPRMNMPRVNLHFVLKKNAINAGIEQLLSLDNGDALLVAARRGNANFFMFTSPLFGPFSNFSRHALFVPAFYRIAMSCISQQPAYYTIHPDVVIGMRNRDRNDEQPPHIVGKDGATDIIPEKRTVYNRMLLFPRNQITGDGYYTLTRQGEELLPLAFNHSRLESDLTIQTAEELRTIAGQKGWRNVRVVEHTGETAGAQVLLNAGDNQLWKLFIFLALVFFFAECLLLRFFR